MSDWAQEAHDLLPRYLSLPAASRIEQAKVFAMLDLADAIRSLGPLFKIQTPSAPADVEESNPVLILGCLVGCPNSIQIKTGVPLADQAELIGWEFDTERGWRCPFHAGTPETREKEQS